MKTFRIDVDYVFSGNDNSPLIAEFVSSFSAVLYSGKGGTATFLKHIKITPDFPMRCMVGIPEEELTPQTRLLAESYCQHFMQLKTRELWTSERLWQPKNLSRVDAPLDQCMFDEDWMKTFGLSRGRWESDILMSSSALSRQEKFPNRKGVYEQNARLLLALAVYGFSDPWQFFTAAK